MNVEEFVAHTANVNCLTMGKKTSRLLITGGDDHKVNVWAIGKTTSLMVNLYVSLLLRFLPSLALGMYLLCSDCFRSLNSHFGSIDANKKGDVVS